MHPCCKDFDVWLSGRARLNDIRCMSFLNVTVLWQCFR